MLMMALRAAVDTWQRNRARRSRLRRAPELILRAHLLMRDKEIRDLKQQLRTERVRMDELQVEVYNVRATNETLVWARCQTAGLARLSEGESQDLVASRNVVI
jgi:hypothetical protein